MWSWIKNTVIWILEFLGFRVKVSNEEKKLTKDIKKSEKEMEKLERKLNKLKKKGVEDKSLQEEVDYWKNQ